MNCFAAGYHVPATFAGFHAGLYLSNHLKLQNNGICTLVFCLYKEALLETIYRMQKISSSHLNEIHLSNAVRMLNDEMMHF